MAVIAMTREMGSLGKDVAAALADQMGLKVVHHELIEHDLAERLGVQESAVHRYLEGGASLFERWKIDKQKLSRYTTEEILELAGQGNVVIRGWGATGVLRHIPNGAPSAHMCPYGLSRAGDDGTARPHGSKRRAP